MRGWMAIAGAVLLTSCLAPATIEVTDAWVRLPAVPGRPAAAYFTLRGGAQPTTLIAVTADLAVRAEMHATMAAGHAGAMTMRPLGDVQLPAEGELRFQPGGRHLMLYDVSPSLAPGGSTVLTFSFADGRRIQRRAWAIGAGDAAPD